MYSNVHVVSACQGFPTRMVISVEIHHSGWKPSNCVGLSILIIQMFMYVYLFLSVQSCMHRCVCEYVCMFVSVCVCMCVFM